MTARPLLPLAECIQGPRADPLKSSDRIQVFPGRERSWLPRHGLATADDPSLDRKWIVTQAEVAGFRRRDTAQSQRLSGDFSRVIRITTGVYLQLHWQSISLLRATPMTAR